MRTTRKGALLALFTCLIILPFASAEVLLSQPKSLYNFGDEFSITLTVQTQSYAAGYLTATLVCPNGDVELFRSPISIQPNKEKVIPLEMNFDNFLVSGMEGQCHIKATFMDETFTTPKFELSRRVAVTLNINAPVFDPGSKVAISGEAIKENNEPLNGFVEVSVPDIEFNHVSTVKSGPFNFSFNIPQDAPAGSYKIEVRAYEEDSFGDTINEGKASNIIRVNQVVRKIEIAYEKQTLPPSEDLQYTVYLYDQSGKEASQDVSLEVYRPSEELFKKEIIRSNELQTLELEPSFAPGYWKLLAKYEGLQTQRDFLIEEFKDLSFKLENETLLIENTGNVPYNGPVEVVIGSENQVRDIENLALGATKRFRLRAPDGEYKILAGNGPGRAEELGPTLLTGNAVSVDDINESFGSSLYILLGLIVILIAIVAFVLIFKKYRKGSMLIKPSKDKMSSQGSAEQKALEKGAAATLIDKGEKQDSAILVLNLKNAKEFQSNQEVLKSIDSALWKAKESGAKIYTDADFRIAIFAPILTKEKDNSLRAASAAQAMDRILQSHNKRSQAKIQYGIAIHHGTLIVEKKDGQFKFMSVTNIIGSTKKVSTQANQEILVTEPFHNKTLGRVKKSKLKDKNLWKLERVVDRSEHSEYIKNLSLKRKVDHHTNKNHGKK
jgi:hypothetical protein